MSSDMMMTMLGRGAELAGAGCWARIAELHAATMTEKETRTSQDQSVNLM